MLFIGTIPGPKGPKKHLNSYLKLLVEELLDLWNGSLLKTSSLFGIVPVRYALICVSCDPAAVRKVCGFTSFYYTQGCSKCMKQFTCTSFSSKLDYSGLTEIHGLNAHMLFMRNMFLCLNRQRQPHSIMKWKRSMV